MHSRFALLFVILTGCTGSVGSTSPAATDDTAVNDGRNGAIAGGAEPKEGGKAGATDTTQSCGPGAAMPGPSPLRRLTLVEYANTVRDLLGTRFAAFDGFPPDVVNRGFDNFASGQTVSPLHVEVFDGVAAALAAEAVKQPAVLLTCDVVKTGEDDCVKAFIPKFGGRGFRRPLTASEVDRLTSFYQTAKAKYGFTEALGLLVQAVLHSPSFLYRLELGNAPPPGESRRLTGHEIAVRLSYFFWQTMPDAELFNAAASGALDRDAGVVTEARRLLASPRTHTTIRAFFHAWLQMGKDDALTKDATIYPAYGPTLAKAFRSETDAMIDDVIVNGDGRIDTLLAAKYTMANKPLADFYGLSGPKGSAFEKVATNNERLGLLSQGSLLSALAGPEQSSPILRGKFVREQLFCQDLPPVPDNLNVQAPTPTAAMTTRERFAEHNANPSCAACHVLMDPIGFAFENYDAIGKFRSKEVGKPIDARGELKGTDVDGVFDGLPPLVTKVTSSSQVQRCMALNWFRFAAAREETEDDECTLAQLEKTFASANHDMRQLMLAVTQTPMFLSHLGGPQ